MPVPVSILIPIKNEAANLPRCLALVAWADEIFVVDSQSSDGSQQIVERHGAKVVQRRNLLHLSVKVHPRLWPRSNEQELLAKNAPGERHFQVRAE